MKNKKHYVTTLVCLLLILSNVTASPLLPALTSPPTNKALPGKIIWADIFTENVEQTISFYTEVFGWTVKEFESEGNIYHFFINNGKPVAGIVPQLSVSNKSNDAVWINHISTADINEAVKKASSKGAKTLFPPKPFGTRGIDAIISDPQGALIGLLESNSGDPIDTQAVVGGWVWAQLFSSDLEKTAEFYASVFGYKLEQASHVNNKDTYMLVSNNKARAGLAPLPTDVTQRSRWVGFVSVDTINTVLVKAKEMGAKIIFSPNKNVFNARIAIIADTNGALIGLLSKTDSEQ